MVAVCTYNEADNIELVVTGLRKALPDSDVIVVDDNSPDGISFEKDSRISLSCGKMNVDWGGNPICDAVLHRSTISLLHES